MEEPVSEEGLLTPKSIMNRRPRRQESERGEWVTGRVAPRPALGKRKKRRPQTRPIFTDGLPTAYAQVHLLPAPQDDFWDLPVRYLRTFDKGAYIASQLQPIVKGPHTEDPAVAFSALRNDLASHGLTIAPDDFASVVSTRNSFGDILAKIYVMDPAGRLVGRDPKQLFTYTLRSGEAAEDLAGRAVRDVSRKWCGEGGLLEKQRAALRAQTLARRQAFAKKTKPSDVKLPRPALPRPSAQPSA